jgi:abelson tyrosine-protein kinase 1
MFNVLQNFCREILLWKDLKHPGVLPFLGIHLDCDGYYFIVTPWMKKGSVRRYLQDKGSTHLDLPRLVSTSHYAFSLLLVICIQLLEIAEAVAYLHGKGVVHGDLRAVRLAVTLSSSTVTHC